MAVCPVCDEVIPTQHTRCPACGAELADEQSGDSARLPGDFVCEIYRGVPDVKLHLLRSLLEGSGISMHVQTIGMGPWTELGGLSAVTGMPSELNAARILVRRQDVERAEALLRAAESGALSLRAEGPGDRGGPPPAEP